MGFNGVMLEEGLQVEEIYVTLSDDFEALEADLSSVFEPIFAPFPGILHTPNKVYQIPVQDLSSAISLSKSAQMDTPQIGSSGSHRNEQGRGGGEEDGDDSGSEKSDKGGKDGEGGGGGGRGREGGGGGNCGHGKSSCPRGRRVLNIPGFGSTLTIEGPNGSHRVNAIGGLDIVVSRRSNVMILTHKQ